MGFWVHLAAGKQPERVAIECGERSITYEELSRRTIEASRALGALGAGGGDRIALEIGDRFDFALALHACLLNASPAVPIDRRLGEKERVARRAGARAGSGSLAS